MKAIIPDWQVPQNIRSFTTTRQGGVSAPPFDSFNLGDHVGDDKSAVRINRILLSERFGLPQFPLFLNQIHGTRVLRLPYQGEDLNADAVYSNQPHQVCLVMTADCLPVLFCNQSGTEVAAAHAGWRGLCDGILEEAVKQFTCPPDEIIAWFGPAIGPTAFQVGREVMERFTDTDPKTQAAFVRDKSAVGNDRYLANLYKIAARRLNRAGITQVSGGEHCTYSEEDRFFSYRRDGTTGRMASCIWFE